MLGELLVVVVIGTPGLCVAAYFIGRRRRQGVTIPWRPIFQLLDHRLYCLGQDPAQIQRELTGQLPVPAEAWEELLSGRQGEGRRP